MILFKEDLLRRACSTEGCNHQGEQLRFRSVCHPDVGVDALYRFATGDVVLVCKTCAATVIALGIGSRPPSMLSVANEPVPQPVRLVKTAKTVHRPKKKPKR